MPGSWSVQIQLPYGRRTWCNFPPSDNAPTAKDIVETWLPTYVHTTRAVWENLLDPRLFDGQSATFPKLTGKSDAARAALQVRARHIRTGINSTMHD